MINLISLDQISVMSIISIMLIIFLGILLYRYLKGSVAFYILVGFLVVFLVSYLLNKIGFTFLSSIINQFTTYGVLFIAIIFQQELRGIFLSIGNNRLSKQIRLLRNKLLDISHLDRNQLILKEILEAINYMSERKIGGTIVFAEPGDIESILETGTLINARISGKLIESIFVKESPLHDGAIIIQNQRIKAASCILPLTSQNISEHRTGLRHKSAIGITESTNSLAVVISETTGAISYAKEGRLYFDKKIGTVIQQISIILNS